MRTVRVGRANIHSVSADDAVAAILDEARSVGPRSRPSLVVTPNIHHIAMLRRNQAFRDAYGRAFLVLPDGWPVVAAMRIQGACTATRVAGSDLLPLVAAAAASEGRSIGLVGGAPGSASESAARLTALYDDLRVNIVDEAPSSAMNDADARLNLISRIAGRKVDILFLGLGAPKQELFALEFRAATYPRVIVCVGAGIDFLSGATRRAPRFMRQCGLEWLHRLAVEPRRLGPRYMRSIPIFIWEVAQGMRASRSRSVGLGH